MYMYQPPPGGIAVSRIDWLRWFVSLLTFVGSNISKTVGDKRLGSNGPPPRPPIDGIWRTEWSRDDWLRHRPRDTERSRSWPSMFAAYYLESGWRYKLGYNGTPIGDIACGIKWSRARHHVALKGPGRAWDILGCKYLEHQWRARLDSRGPPIGNGMWRIEWTHDWFENQHDGGLADVCKSWAGALFYFELHFRV